MFPDAAHRFCFWHILENIKNNLKSYLDARGTMRAQIWYLIKNAFTPDQFEDGWKNIIEEHKVERNAYLIQLFDSRELWAPAYFKDKMYPFS